MRRSSPDFTRSSSNRSHKSTNQRQAPEPARRLTRRQWLGAAIAASAWRGAEAAARDAVASRPIPSSGEALPAIGLGSWITFNVGNDRGARSACTEVVRAFFEAGGRMIDSSPMYGSSQKVIGYGLAKLKQLAGLFSADKVWISPGSRGPGQIAASRRYWGVRRFDLLQVHNLLSWEEHLRTLFAMKAAGIPSTDITASLNPNIFTIEDLRDKEAKHNTSN